MFQFIPLITVRTVCSGCHKIILAASLFLSRLAIKQILVNDD